MANLPPAGRKVIPLQKLKRFVDLNTDLGQTRDRRFYDEHGEQFLPLISSVNIPCCVHDGTPIGVLNAIEMAKRHHCAIGAHIAYPDPAHYGYRASDLSREELAAWIIVQIGAIQALLRTKGVDVEHVRPHGALYSAFINNMDVARTVAETIYKMNPWWILVGPAGPILQSVQDEVGIRIAPEIYLGKRYGADGYPLMEQFQNNLSPQALLDQARQLMTDSSLTTREGQVLKVEYKTLHINPKMEGSLGLAEKLNIVIGQPVALPVVAVGDSGWI
jgi:UPF0271 protein